MVDAVAMGRKIYANLKKAIQYIISIHIPIILTVFVPLILGWQYPNIFSPVHVIFLELIMSPTCSIIYENEPIEKNAMLQPPKPFTKTFFNIVELSTSIMQGIAITIGTLAAYQYAVYNGYNEALTRTLVFIVLIAANIFLTLSNRSFYYSFYYHSLQKQVDSAYDHCYHFYYRLTAFCKATYCFFPVSATWLFSTIFLHRHWVLFSYLV